MSGLRGRLLVVALMTVSGVGIFSSIEPAFADYYNGDSYGGSAGGYGNYGGGYGNYGGGGYGYGGGGGSSSPIISLELNEKESLNSSLRVAAREDRLSDLKRMIAHGGDINSQSDHGASALIYASRNCSKKIVDFLLTQKNADGTLKLNVNLRDHLGRTALIYAASDSCAPVVKRLLEVQDIEVSFKDHYGRTIRDYALYGSELEMGGPASETYALIRAAEQRARLRHRKLIAKNTATH